MSLTRRTLLKFLSALLPLNALGLGRAPTLPIQRLPEPAEGGGRPPFKFSEPWVAPILSDVEKDGLIWGVEGGGPKPWPIPESELRAAVNVVPGAHLRSREEHRSMLAEHLAREMDEAMLRHPKGGGE